MSSYWNPLQRLLAAADNAEDQADQIIEKGWAPEANRQALIDLLAQHQNTYIEDSDYDYYCACGKWLEYDCYDLADHQSALLTDTDLLTPGNPWDPPVAKPPATPTTPVEVADAFRYPRREFNFSIQVEGLRWWRLQRIPADTRISGVQDINGRNDITLTIGDQTETWPTGTVRMTFEQPQAIEPLTEPVRTLPTRLLAIDVLTTTPPTVGGPWEPLTQPDQRTHPDNEQARRNPHFPGMCFYTTNGGTDG